MHVIELEVVLAPGMTCMSQKEGGAFIQFLLSLIHFCWKMLAVAEWKDIGKMKMDVSFLPGPGPAPNKHTDVLLVIKLLAEG